MMQLVDTHCHLDFEIFDEDRDDILFQCKSKGINSLVFPAVTAKRWNKLIQICQSSESLHLALGLHPLFLNDHTPEHLEQLPHAIEHYQPIALGEIGLDFYHEHYDEDTQIYYFIEQLKIAKAFDLPVLLHVRKAHDNVINLLKKQGVPGGIAHAFNGSFQQAQAYQKLGFKLGVGGIITHPKAVRLRTLFSQLPLSQIVLETDAPDMPLYNQISPRNTPENLVTILDTLTTLRPESRQEIAEITTNNSLNVLKLVK